MEPDLPNYVPGEQETIAAKRSARIAEKLGRSQKGALRRSWLSSLALEVCGLGAIVALNLLTVWQFLGTATPTTTFSGPVVPLLAKLFELFGFEFSYGLQLVNVFFYLGFVAAFYLLVRNISGRKLAGYVAVLVVSLPVSLFSDVRIRMAFVGQDSPHIASLTITMITISMMLGFIRSGGVWKLVLNVVMVAIVGLTSPTGFLALLVFVGVTVFSEMLLGQGRLKATRAILVIALAVGLSSFWYNPGFLYWLVMGPTGVELRQVLGKLVPVSMFAVPLLTIFGFLLFDRKPGWQSFFLALFYSVCFTGMIMASGEQGGWQTSKFLSEFGLSAAFLIGVVTMKLFGYVRRMEAHWLGVASWGGIAVIVLGCVGTITLLRQKVYDGEQNRVLGLWTGVEKDQIWAKRDEFLASSSSYLGTIISSVTVIAMLGILMSANKKVAV